MAGKMIVEGTRVHAGLSALSRWRLRRSGAALFERLSESAPERRREKRRGVRLNWGKALDVSERFLCDCRIVDRATGGARLHLVRNITPPARFYLFDEAEGAVYAALIVWRQGAEIGCRLSLSPLRDKAHVAQRMKGRYYAL
ncbi:MAG: PilZ domain-containing protein [Methylocystis sp.]|uniref:PilZ domain-containing protein n=1 Tax=Methylocystis sp. TaxID=1911079 RepID=UPI003DA42303